MFALVHFNPMRVCNKLILVTEQELVGLCAGFAALGGGSRLLSSLLIKGSGHSSQFTKEKGFYS